jgi:tetratricopeptide (TPR) repeat protein
VYPIDSQSTRTIRLTFIAPLCARGGLVLPFMSGQPVRALAFTVRSSTLDGLPKLVLPGAPAAPEWRRVGNRLTASLALSNARLAGNLQIEPARSKHSLFVSAHSNGRGFFQFSEDVQPQRSSAAAPRRIRIYWDRSLSRRDDAVAKEIALLNEYLRAVKPDSIDVVLFQSSSTDVKSFTAIEPVQALLTDVVYRGATSFNELRHLRLPKADKCLIFSDGVATIDRRDRFQPHCDTVAITSAADADHAYLQRLTGAPQAVLRMDSRPADSILPQLLRPAPRILDIRERGGRSLPFTSLNAAPGRVCAVGEIRSNDDIVVRMADGERAFQRGYSWTLRDDFDGPGALWAADQVAYLAGEENRLDELRAVSRRFSVASSLMSFIVLETPRDYVVAGLAPPQTYPAEARGEYLELLAEHAAQTAESRAEHRQALMQDWKDQKDWWRTEYDENAPAPPRTPRSPRSRGSSGGWGWDGGGGDDPTELQQIVVTGMRRPSGPMVRVEITPWQPDRPYLQALDAATGGNLEAVLAEQETLHGAIPAFYFDVAEWFLRRGLQDQAMDMLLSALELPSRSNETVLAVADRLLRFGQLDRAIWLYERVHALEPDRPQPKRTLALALAQRAAQGSSTHAERDLQRAIDLLTEVVLQPWDETYDGIARIALMDLNGLLPRLRALSDARPALDRRLIALLDLDLRIIVDWNTAATDIDLWVDEPNGERAVYDNPRTRVGGLLSNDMTAGYGPEEYLLRHAPAGKYRVYIDHFAADVINPNGATVVTARLIHNFGRMDERTETIELELLPDAQEQRLVGEIVVAR